MDKNRFDLEAQIYRAVMEARRRRPLIELERELASRFSVTPKMTRRILRGLVSAGRLAYVHEHGATLLGPAFSGPVRLTDRFVVVPPNVTPPAADGDHTIVLDPGAAFGDGSHATTRIALRLLERFPAVVEMAPPFPKTGIGLDIGTGSGILAIALAKQVPTLRSVLALDIDACARSQARANLRLNQLAHRISVSDRSLDAVEDPVAVALANLRFPTLKAMAGSLAESLLPGGWALCSGLLEVERDTLIRRFATSGLTPVAVETEGRWAGAAFRRLG